MKKERKQILALSGVVSIDQSFTFSHGKPEESVVFLVAFADVVDSSVLSTQCSRFL